MESSAIMRSGAQKMIHAEARRRGGAEQSLLELSERKTKLLRAFARKQIVATQEAQKRYPLSSPRLRVSACQFSSRRGVHQLFESGRRMRADHELFEHAGARALGVGAAQPRRA